MTTREVLTTLKSLRNEKMIVHNKKYGAGENQFGVKMGDIRNLANKIKANHELALELWQTNNIDAMLLATLIIKVKSLSVQDVNKMVLSINFVQVADWFYSNIIKDYPERESLREKWMTSQNPWVARLGWSLMVGRITRNPEGINLAEVLDLIESKMPAAPPEVQWTMNTTLAQIGIHFREYRKRAIEIGEKLGVYRDYPVSKGCTSPFAPVWIKEMVRRQTS